MREFDDGSSLAASVPTDQLTPVISDLQRIRRDAEDQPTPPCLATLKSHQISHMNLVIGTLINLIQYANGAVGKDVIDQGIALARQEHDNYTIELARVLGLTPVAASTIDPSTATKHDPHAGRVFILDEPRLPRRDSGYRYQCIIHAHV
jgi:hypothetical protein